jgi:hypothetical protein
MKHVAIKVLFPALLSAACHSARAPDPAADGGLIALLAGGHFARRQPRSMFSRRGEWLAPRVPQQNCGR